MSKERRIRKGIETETEARQFSAGLQTLVELPLLEALEANGGRARPKDVYDQVADAVGIAPEARHETRSCADGQSYKVFEQQVRWARQTAVAQGLISGERGIWELTDGAYAKLGRIRRGAAVLVYSTDDGFALWAHAEEAANYVEAGSVKLVLTSPPYPVVKRSYGRYSVPEWLRWMKHLLAIWKELVSSDGTIAVNLMDVFVSGTPALSPYVERFTLSAIDEIGLHLTGRMPWHSPTKLGNIEWTAKRKVAPKNTLEHVLLFSKSPTPGWDITRMDRQPYVSRGTSKLRSDRKRKKEKRPSGLDINSDAFNRRQDGPLPGNLIVAGGVSGNDTYSRRCRDAGVQPHPARFPDLLPRHVILLTTDLGDVCYDPMAGSNKTGEVASALGRRWISSEPMLE